MTEVGKLPFDIYIGARGDEDLTLVGTVELPVLAGSIDENGHVGITPDVPQMLRNVAHEMVVHAVGLEAKP